MRLCDFLPAMAMVLVASQPALALDGSFTASEMDHARSLLAERLDGQQLRGTLGAGIATEGPVSEQFEPRTSEDESTTAPVSHTDPLRKPKPVTSARKNVRHSRLRKRKSHAASQIARVPP